MFSKHCSERSVARRSISPTVCRVVLVAGAVAALGAAGYALSRELRIHGSIPAMARAYERQARMEREQVGGGAQQLSVIQTHPKGEHPQMTNKHRGQDVK